MNIYLTFNESETERTPKRNEYRKNKFKMHMAGKIKLPYQQLNMVVFYNLLGYKRMLRYCMTLFNKVYLIQLC